MILQNLRGFSSGFNDCFPNVTRQEHYNHELQLTGKSSEERKTGDSNKAVKGKEAHKLLGVDAFQDKFLELI